VIFSSIRLLPRPGQLALLVLAFLAGSVGVRAQPVVAGTLPEDYAPGLKEILEVALKQSPQMLLKNLDLAQAEVNRYFSDAPLLPNVSGSAGYGLSGSRTVSNPPSTSSSTGLTYGVGFGQSLYQWGALKAQSDIGKLAQQTSERQYAESYRNLALMLRAQYLNLILKKIGLRVSRFQLKLQETSLAALEEQLKDGNISEGEIINPRLGFQEATLNLDRAGQDYEYALRVFQRLAGLDQLKDENIPGDIAHPAYAADSADSLLASFLQGGIEHTLQAQTYELGIRQNELSYKIARTGQYYPKFSFSANYALSNSSQVIGNVSTSSAGISYGYGINASVPIFNGFTTHAQKVSALNTKRSTQQQLRNYLDSTADGAQNLRKQLGFLARGVELAETRRALQEDAVRKVTEQLSEGTAAQSVVDATKIQFYAADFGAINARVEFLNRWSEFVSLVGNDPILSSLPARYLQPSHGK